MENIKQCSICEKYLLDNKRKYCSEFCSKIGKKEIQKKYDRKNTQNKKKYYEENKEHISHYYKKYNKINKDIVKENKKEYYSKNKLYLLEERKKYYNENKQRIRDYCKNNREKLNSYYKDKLKDPVFKIHSYMSKHIRKSLEINDIVKKGRKWENIVGYTSQELKEHLESLFSEGMSWENHGKWHIDHIVPKSFFKFNSIDDVEFKYCWSLNNLQPLWAKENLEKNNKIDEKYLKNTILF